MQRRRRRRRRWRRFLDERYVLYFPGVTDSNFPAATPGQAFHYPHLPPFPVTGHFPTVSQQIGESITSPFAFVIGEAMKMAVKRLTTACSGSRLTTMFTSRRSRVPSSPNQRRVRLSGTPMTRGPIPRKSRGSHRHHAQNLTRPALVIRRDSLQPAAIASVELMGETLRVGCRELAMASPPRAGHLDRAARLLFTRASLLNEFEGPSRGLGRRVPLALHFYASSRRLTLCTISRHRHLRQMKTLKFTQRAVAPAAAVTRPPREAPPGSTRALGLRPQRSEARGRRTRGRTPRPPAHGTDVAETEARAAMILR